MKILVLNGSPKKNSDTFRLTDAFMKGLNRDGEHEVQIIDNFLRCFHPSAVDPSHQDAYFYCFGCGATGDVIDLTARLRVLCTGCLAEIPFSVHGNISRLWFSEGCGTTFAFRQVVDTI